MGTVVTGRRGGAAQDRALATHVLSVHKHGRAPRAEGLAGTLPPDQLRAYIAHAKQRNPFVPDSLTGVCRVRMLPLWRRSPTLLGFVPVVQRSMYLIHL